ncbi:MAG: ubiquinone biosynthesis regulatory protein kinase UbiB [Candidatus Accumulibacter sp.]|jgi:ubiquinone biosynthesis protein|nr:ubiquinone biosynthesis regulatory protein kinase UbiB [Accumulibacter sp.]
MHLFRIARILGIARRHGIDEMLVRREPTGRLAAACRFLCLKRRHTGTEAVRLRRFLEDLGPIFVKFGQVLSTRRDLLPVDIADEFAKLQDHVPPFPAIQAHAQIETAYGKPAREVFAEFDETPVASASVAQVHFARLRAEDGGHEVAVKILRPDIENVIANDLALLDSLARLVEWLWSDGKRMKPRKIVAEFAKYLGDELDLMREAANGSQLRRNFKNSKLLLVPEMYWDFCSTSVMVMDRMHGIPISHNDTLVAAGIDLTELARAGVEIFLMQVFRDGFFHADMHPGNVFVAVDGEDKGKFIALDFGIIGTLTDADKNYLARSFVAFFRRDYKGVATAHVEAGWVPPDTRTDEFESAIRAICEPVFDRPLREISFGKVLLNLFQISRRFNIEVQPQLVMLQKTLLNVEGLGRQLAPDLDLWQAAQPFVERWVSEQLGWRALLYGVLDESPHWARALPQLPRLVHQALRRDSATRLLPIMDKLAAIQRRQNRLLTLIATLLLVWLATQYL